MANRQAKGTGVRSTKWEWRLCKISLPPGGESALGAVLGAGAPLSRRDTRKPLDIRVRYRGGPEASWLIEYRGKCWRYAGHLALHDVLNELFMSTGGARVARAAG